MTKLELVKGKDDEKFEFLYHGFIIGGSLIKEKGIKVLKRELRILDKLEAISQPCECGRKVLDEEDRVLPEGTGTLILEDDEVDTLYNYIGCVPWSTGKSIRGALKTLDWLKT